jgi:hypothetical protein
VSFLLLTPAVGISVANLFGGKEIGYELSEPVGLSSREHSTNQRVFASGSRKPGFFSELK